MIKKKQKRNPQDATMRNIRALKNRVTRLEQDVRALLPRIAKIEASDGRKVTSNSVVW